MTGNSRGTKGNIKEGKGRERDGLGTLEKTQQMYDIVLCKYRTRGQKSYWILLIFLNVKIAGVLGYFTDMFRRTFISLTF